MIRRALGIIPSVASTAKNGFNRVLSLTGSFNDRTSLLLAAAPEPEPSQPQQEPAAPVTIGVAFDVEAATPPVTVAGDEQSQDRTTSEEDVDVEAKRVAKSVHTVCLFAASASIVLFVNLPSNSKPGAGVPVLYSVDMAFICLGLFTSLGLSMFSIVAKSGTNPAAVARVQKQAMVMAVAFVLVSFTLRVAMMLPPRSFEPAWLVFVFLAGAVAVYLALAWKLGGGGPRGAQAASGSAVAGTADRV
ncbi:hypothetical protein PR202_ga23217 [Eleusine coracana subsp. coracana]|uniref:Uncharacterized protein n=1 Tax=Eleusine coracana subsp. coracana TaxID=191504 RepID=A0AAV5D542_ELECO|nr:hypothetical protein PR202_ga23217 [Eleusine coracana subsp. coracana]